MIIDHKQFGITKLNSADKVYEILKKVHSNVNGFDRDKEHFYVIGLTRRHTIKYIDLVSFGSISGTVSEPREIYRQAIHRATGGGIIISHTHPSGNLEPSEADKKLTAKIKDAGRILEIPLIDHIIFTNEDDGFFSFANEGMV